MYPRIPDLASATQHPRSVSCPARDTPDVDQPFAAGDIRDFSSLPPPRSFLIPSRTGPFFHRRRRVYPSFFSFSLPCPQSAPLPRLFLLLSLLRCLLPLLRSRTARFNRSSYCDSNDMPPHRMPVVSLAHRITFLSVTSMPVFGVEVEMKRWRERNRG